MALIIKKTDLDKYTGTFEVMKYIINVWVSDFRTGTYGELCEEVLKNGNDGLAASWVLKEIEDYCLSHGLPRLNVLCVNKKSHRPGDWVYDSEKEYAWRRRVLEVFNFNWKRIQFE
jgi:hypothetical protein